MPRGSYAAASVTKHRSTRVLTVQACEDNAPSIKPGQEPNDLGRAIRRYSQNEVSAVRIFKQIKFCRHLCPASAVMAKCPVFILTANPIKYREVQEPSNISHAALATLPTQHKMPPELHNLRRSRQIPSRGRGGRAAVTRRPSSPCHQSGALLFPEQIVGMTCTTRYLYGHFTFAKPIWSVYRYATSSSQQCLTVPSCTVPCRAVPACPTHTINTHAAVPDPTAIKLSLPGPTPDPGRRRSILTPANSATVCANARYFAFFLDGIVSTKPISTVAHAATVAIALGVVKQCAAP